MGSGHGDEPGNGTLYRTCDEGVGHASRSVKPEGPLAGSIRGRYGRDERAIDENAGGWIEASQRRRGRSAAERIEGSSRPFERCGGLIR